MTIRVDFDELDTSDDGYGTLLLKGEPFSGLAYEVDSSTGMLVSLAGIHAGKFHGASREWYPSGLLKREAYESMGGYHGPLRQWHENGQLAVDEFWKYKTVLRRRRWAEDGTLQLDQRLEPGSAGQKRLQELPPEYMSEPIVDISLERWEFFERDPSWGLDPSDLPPPTLAPRPDRRFFEKQ